MTLKRFLLVLKNIKVSFCEFSNLNFVKYFLDQGNQKIVLGSKDKILDYRIENFLNVLGLKN